MNANQTLVWMAPLAWTMWTDIHVSVVKTMVAPTAKPVRGAIIIYVAAVDLHCILFVSRHRWLSKEKDLLEITGASEMTFCRSVPCELCVGNVEPNKRAISRLLCERVWRNTGWGFKQRWPHLLHQSHWRGSKSLGWRKDQYTCRDVSWHLEQRVHDDWWW